MAGCFGSHPIDKWMEKQLDDYLDEQEIFNCENINCEYHSDGEDWGYDDDADIMICPKCKTELKL